MENKENWETKRLTEICRPKQWKTLSTSELLNEGYSVYGANGIIGFYNEYTHEKPTLMITCRGATCGNLHISEPFSYINGNAMALDNLDEEIDLKYLYYFFKNRGFSDVITGSAQPQITGQGLSQVIVHYPNLSTQHHIATVLDHATALIEKRKAQIAELDKLVKALFLEMFGDPETNKKCFPILYWKSIFNTTTGKLDANAMKENGKYPFFTCAKEIYYIDDYAFDCEALLLAGNNANANYDVKHYSGKFNAYQRTYVLTLKNPEHSYDFFRISLENQLGILKNKSIGTNTRYLTMGILSELKFIVPPIESQTLFAEKVCKIQAEKDRLQRSLAEMEQYLQSLMAKFFE